MRKSNCLHWHPFPYTVFYHGKQAIIFEVPFLYYLYPNQALNFIQRGTPRIADFAHGSDGLGNVFLPPAKSKKYEKSASEFLVEKVSEYPGEVSILALGPLTNLALVSCLSVIIILQFSNPQFSVSYLFNITFFWNLGYKERLILCEQGEESGCTWWSFLCIGKR